MPASKNPLLVPELLRIVLESLAGPNEVGLSFATPDREIQRALAVLARTCKAFTGPALDFLWRRLTSLEPLVRCFATWYVLENKPFLVGRLFLEMKSRLTSTASSISSSMGHHQAVCLPNPGTASTR